MGAELGLSPVQPGARLDKLFDLRCQCDIFGTGFCFHFVRLRFPE